MRHHILLLVLLGCTFHAVERVDLQAEGANQQPCLISGDDRAGKARKSCLIFIGPGPGGEAEARSAHESALPFATQEGMCLITPISTNGRGFIDDGLKILAGIIRFKIKEGSIDERRVYIGGISRGGVAALQFAGLGCCPIAGVIAVPGLFYREPKEVAGFKGTGVFLRIGSKDDMNWGTQLDLTKGALLRWGAKVDAALVQNGGHVFAVNWDEVKRWKDGLQKK